MQPAQLLRSIGRQLELLNDALLRPSAAELAPGALVQLAPEAHPVYGRCFLLVRQVLGDDLRGLPLVVHRGDWIRVPRRHTAPLGHLHYAAPQFGFDADPKAAAVIRAARNQDYRDRSAHIAALRAAAIARKKAS